MTDQTNLRKCNRCQSTLTLQHFSTNSKGDYWKTCDNCRSKFECPREGCNLKFSQNSNLQKHIKGYHDKLKDFECGQCGHKFSTKGNLQTHIKGYHDKIKDFECEQCGHKFSQNVDLQRHIKGYHDKIKDFECPREGCDYKCSRNGTLQRHIKTCTGKLNISSGELACMKALEIYDEEYKTEYTFPNCKDKSHLRFDFYLPNYNACIEYDGRQHFEPQRFGGISREKALENLKTCQQRDEIKNEHCRENGIKLLRIPYYRFEEVYEMIGEFILECNK